MLKSHWRAGFGSALLAQLDGAVHRRQEGGLLGSYLFWPGAHSRLRNRAAALRQVDQHKK
eukprot:9503533-Pyramimonas_sp.AAC.1